MLISLLTVPTYFVFVVIAFTLQLNPRKFFFPQRPSGQAAGGSQVSLLLPPGVCLHFCPQVSSLHPPRRMPSFLSRIGVSIPVFQFFVCSSVFIGFREFTLSCFPLGI